MSVTHGGLEVVVTKVQPATLGWTNTPKWWVGGPFWSIKMARIIGFGSTSAVNNWHRLGRLPFQSIGPLGRCFLSVEMSVCLSVCPSVCLSVHF